MTRAARRGAEPPALLWLATSLVVHAGLALILVWRGGAWLAQVGEHGHGGAGGPLDEVEVSIVGDPSLSRDEPARDEPTRDEPTRDEPTRDEPTRDDDERPPTDVSPNDVRSSPARLATAEHGLAVSEPTGADTSRAPSDEVAAAAGSGEGEDGSRASSHTGDEGASGLTPHDDARALILGSAGRLEGGSVRASALLGESLSCDDPIAGTWVAYRYSPEFRDWARFTLRITHEGASLRGTIVARMWRGLPSDRRPPPCSAEGWDYTVTMLATGNLLGDRMAFGASTHEVTRVDCASPLFAYNPDHFSGSVDALADRMHTVNNDGGRDVNAPYEFRRTGCEP